MRALALVGVLFVLTRSGELRADEDRAKAAYAMGDEAFKAGRYQEAANAFALADEESPHAVALTSALKAVILADDPVLGMTLVDRAPARKATPDLTAQVDRARKQFAARAGLVSIVCTCDPTLNGRAVKPNTRFWAAAGAAKVAVGARSFDVTVSPSSPLDFVVPAEAPKEGPATPLDAAAPPVVPVPPAPLPVADDDGGLSPALFGVMAGLTVASGACLTGFGARALILNDAFQEGDDDAKSTGQTFQTLANAFIAVTAASAITAVVLVPFTDFGGEGGKVSLGAGNVAFTLTLP